MHELKQPKHNKPSANAHIHHAESPFKGKTGLRRLLNALGYSLEGFKAAFKHEDAFRQEVLLAVVMIPSGIYLGNNTIEQALLVASILLVLIVELLNSAIEAAVDHTSTDHHALAKRAKDIGSAAVLLALCVVMVVWGLILFN